MFKDHIAYMNDNPKGYWFKAKLYGWGWMPVTWQGWLVILVYLITLLAIGFLIDENASSQDIAFTFILPLILLTATLIRICFVKGEKPRWQWGPPKKSNS